MKNFKLPSLPANCFGLALGTISEEFEGKSETFDRRTLWFKGKNGKPGIGYREEVEKVVKNSLDTLHPVVTDFPPGSPERIAAMAEFYASGETESAFDISDDDIANRLAHAFDKMLQSESTASLAPAKKELRRERRRQSE